MNPHNILYPALKVGRQHSSMCAEYRPTEKLLCVPMDPTVPLFLPCCKILLARPTCTDWLTTCVLALVVEATLQQPVVLLMTGVLGDFVEEGADFLLEIFDV